MSEYKEGDRVLVDAADGSTGFVEVEITALEYNYFNDLRYRAGKRILHPKEISGYAQAPAQETDTDEPNERARILAESEQLINGDRAKDYGDPATNFGRLAALWAPILGVDVTPVQVALCLTQLKISRLINTPTHRDSYLDAAGYIGLAAELAKEQK